MAKDVESLKIKSDDIDGCLAADFDGSLSGLGVEIVSNTYNMSEALEALPSLFKKETENGILLHQITPLLTNHHLQLASASINHHKNNNNRNNNNNNNKINNNNNNTYHISNDIDGNFRVNANKLKINSTFINNKNNNNKTNNSNNNKTNNNNKHLPIETPPPSTTTKDKLHQQLYSPTDAIFTYNIDDEEEEDDEDLLLKEDDYFFNDENIDAMHNNNLYDNNKNIYNNNIYNNNNNKVYNNGNNNDDVNVDNIDTTSVVVGHNNKNNKIIINSHDLFFDPCDNLINKNNNNNYNDNNSNDNYNNNSNFNISSNSPVYDTNNSTLISNSILLNNTTTTINNHNIIINTTINSPTNNKQPTNPGFSYTLKAATSAGCRTIDEPITYLNQGQWYEVVLRSSTSSFNHLKSTIRLQINNNRLQQHQQQQHIINNWSLNRPGEAMLQLDRSMSGDTHNSTTDNINSVTFDWSSYNHHHHQYHHHHRILPLHPPDQTIASVFIKINCISSEFTPNKHGGEKGIPFKLQIETHVEDELQHVACCQVKVFKMKGADRKNKQERSRREKMTSPEREKYQTCSEVSSFFDIPVNKILNENNNKEKKDNNNNNNNNNINNNKNNNNTTTESCLQSNGNSNDGINTITEEMVYLLPSMHKNNMNKNNINNNNIINKDNTDNSVSTATTSSVDVVSISNKNNNKNINNNNNKLMNDVNIELISGVTNINSRKRPLPDLCPTPLQASSTPEQAALWLSSNRFHDLLDTFENFSGSDLLCLSKDELTQICGLATGIRLYNLLHARNLQPKLTIFVCHVIDPEYWSNIASSVDLKHNSQQNMVTSQQLMTSHVTESQQQIGLALQHDSTTTTQHMTQQQTTTSIHHTDSLIRTDHNYDVTTGPTNEVSPFTFDLINTTPLKTSLTTSQLETPSRDDTKVAHTSSQNVIKDDDKQQNDNDVIVLEDVGQVNAKQLDLTQKAPSEEALIEHDLTSKDDLNDLPIDPMMTPNNPPCYVILPSQHKSDVEDDGGGDGVIGGCSGENVLKIKSADDGEVCSGGALELSDVKNDSNIFKTLSIAAEVRVTSANTAEQLTAVKIAATDVTAVKLAADELTADSMTLEEKSSLPLISTTKTFSISSIFSSIFLPSISTSTFATTKFCDTTTMLMPTTTPTILHGQTQQLLTNLASTTQFPLKPVTVTRTKTTTTQFNTPTTKSPKALTTTIHPTTKHPTKQATTTSTKASTSRPPPPPTPACSCKRSISDFDEGVTSMMKKQRIVPSNHSPQQVFHAVYLNDLSLSHLLHKLALLFPLPVTLVSQLLIRNSMGFYYLVDDSVVQNMREQSSYVIELSPDDQKAGYFKILLKTIGF